MLIAFVAVSCALLPAGPAAAHNSLTGSDPRKGARLAQAPAQVRLTFLSRLDPATTRVTVTGPDNVAATSGRPRFAGSRVTVPVRPGAAGLYIVRYQVASGDGHPIEGEVRFTVTVGVTPSPSVPAGAAPTTPPASPPGVPSNSAAPVATASDDGGAPWWPWALGGVLVIAALAGGLLLRRRAAGRP
ncbi:copper resistance CopC family protein [Plantactinospora sp. CA-290183]|uniref:copper resistance CopC family protein n=1 Tax=Plantactinospora sp. CA-290183 TaxID=3240006 RepID=UPI003D8FEBB2